MNVRHATDAAAWDAFVGSQRFRPFLQSWTMGDVYADIGQQPLRLVAEDGGAIVGVCFAILVPAKRGKHLAVPYGPLVSLAVSPEIRESARAMLLLALRDEARHLGYSFVRLSPFEPDTTFKKIEGGVDSPLHLLAEHVWYMPLVAPDPWQGMPSAMTARSEDEILMQMRKTTRNLIRRAERDGVTIERAPDAVAGLEHFIALHDETRKRHKFTPYTNAFFRAQVKRFAPRGECTVYLAKYQGKTIAASVHMHVWGETSYHHGASSSEYHKIPSSYLLQWTAICDALKRGDLVYNFWGIAPQSDQKSETSDQKPKNSNHPFAGVTLFKTGFGGSLLNLTHCIDLPVKPSYWLTYAFETVRKWRRGF